MIHSGVIRAGILFREYNYSVPDSVDSGGKAIHGANVLEIHCNDSSGFPIETHDLIRQKWILLVDKSGSSLGSLRQILL